MAKREVRVFVHPKDEAYPVVTTSPVPEGAPDHLGHLVPERLLVDYQKAWDAMTEAGEAILRAAGIDTDE